MTFHFATSGLRAPAGNCDSTHIMSRSEGQGTAARRVGGKALDVLVQQGWS